MTDILIYTGKVSVALAVFYIFYRLLLSKETYHRFNRVVLLGTAALSFVLPLCVITINKVVFIPQPVSAEIQEKTAMSVTAALAEQYSESIWPAVLCSILFAGAVSVFLMSVISIMRVRSIIKSGEQQKLDSGEILVITDTDMTSFSWMKYIVISREDYQTGNSHILTHEKAHIALRHSWDLLFVDMITAFQWFNPIIWMLKSDLRALHEFEADDAVLRSGADIKDYQYLLIRKAVGKSGYSVVNSFNHSTLKQRFTMMFNKKSSRMSAWKALYIIPLVGISLAATAETTVDYRYDVQEQDHLTYQQVDVKPAFNGGDLNSFGQWVASQVTYPEECVKEGVAGRVMIEFTVGIDGNVADAKVLRGVHEKLDAEALRVINISPKWTPGVKDGKVVPVTVIFPMVFKMPATESSNYQEVDIKPTFSGGDANEFAKWVASQMKYPEDCAKDGIEGRVMVEFTIKTDGKVGDVKVLRGVHEKLDAEAVRVISMSPDWVPGSKDGKIVPVKFTFPVVFKAN